MKMVINTCFGGFDIADEWKMQNCEKKCGNDCRECTKLIQAIENGENVNGRYADLTVVEIPEEATDYELQEYDGTESLLYVLNGKIKYA